MQSGRNFEQTAHGNLKNLANMRGKSKSEQGAKYIKIQPQESTLERHK